MATLHLHLTSQREVCGYLSDREAVMEYRLMSDVSPGELDWLLERGWRRFGAAYFRPMCPHCQECVSLRIPVDAFRASKSQRRALRDSASLRIEVRSPLADETRLELHRAWHADRKLVRGWNSSDMDLDEYRRTFCTPNDCARELDYFDGERLVAVGYVDVTPRALSSVYFFYHPDYGRMSLGVASVLYEIAWARRQRRRHVYLGYRVSDCPSTAYKQQFRPHELLCDRPQLDEDPRWEMGPAD